MGFRVYRFGVRVYDALKGGLGYHGWGGGWTRVVSKKRVCDVEAGSCGAEKGAYGVEEGACDVKTRGVLCDRRVCGDKDGA